jgi:predicted pyridoxine 5'-phosphate oxidase superfamily flavin-nucleotide-binding protein
VSSAPGRRHEFHEGELSVQEKAGVRAQAGRLAKIVLPLVPAAAEEFLTSLPFVVVGSSDDDGAVWASILTGERGFVRLYDANTIELGASFAAGDPLASSLARARSVGVLAIELATRARVRINGEGVLADKGLTLRVAEFYGNCPHYIHSREVTPNVPSASSPVARSRELTAQQRDMIAAADTLFVASRHPSRGADASHRGGDVGFVHVLGPAELLVPDYPGNNMFNTLGNLASDPRAGILFIDFASGRTLQLTGTGEVVWDRALLEALPGAARAVRLAIREVVENPNGTSLRWSSTGRAS